jgi:hypothetical protein
MNKTFRPHLRKFLLVFFDDILIYNKSWEYHIKHVDRVLQILENNQLYVKRSKCSFGKQEVEYLGHIVSRERVKVDSQKIQAITKWPVIAQFVAWAKPSPIHESVTTMGVPTHCHLR